MPLLRNQSSSLRCPVSTSAPSVLGFSLFDGSGSTAHTMVDDMLDGLQPTAILSAENYPRIRPMVKEHIGFNTVPDAWQSETRHSSCGSSWHKSGRTTQSSSLLEAHARTSPSMGLVRGSSVCAERGRGTSRLFLLLSPSSKPSKRAASCL
jgi:hypothetical protein